MTTDSEITKDLRSAFTPTALEESGLTRVRDAAIAGGLRRRRRAAVTRGGAAGAAVLTVAGVALVVGPGNLIGRQAPSTAAPASNQGAPAPTSRATSATATTTRPAKDWSSSVNATGVFAYDIPDLSTIDLPAGVTPGAKPYVQGDRSDANLDGMTGGCFMGDTDGVERRLPVAGRTWEFDHGSTGGAMLAAAGFTTGTGAKAFDDYAANRLWCARWDDPAQAWTTPAGPAWLKERSQPRLSDPTDIRHLALAAVRVGDVIVTGSAVDSTAAQARAIATGLAEAAAHRLAGLSFPPATGAALGASDHAPNAASAVGAEPAAAQTAREGLYSFGDILPRQDQLPWGATYAGVTLTGAGTPPALGPLGCNNPTNAPVEDRSPLAGVQRDAGIAGNDQTQILIGVTGWPAGRAGSVLADVIADRHPGCAWLATPERLEWPGHENDADFWLAKVRFGNDDAYVAMQRVGDVLVAVTTLGPDDARAQAIRLADLTAQRVAAEVGK